MACAEEGASLPPETELTHEREVSMVQRFVWWDEVEKREVIRREVRIPKTLDDFCREVSKVHGVSFNAFVVGVLVYAADSQTRQRLRLEVVPVCTGDGSKASRGHGNHPSSSRKSGLPQEVQNPQGPIIYVM